MGDKVKLSGGAEKERAKLPDKVRDLFDKHLDRLANDPTPVGLRGTGGVDGISPDGSRYYVEFVFEYKLDTNELFIDTISIDSY